MSLDIMNPLNPLNPFPFANLAAWTSSSLHQSAALYCPMPKT